MSELGSMVAEPEAPATDTPQDQAPDTQVPDTGTPPAAQDQAFTYDRLLEMLPEELRQEKIFQNINRENPVEDMARQFFHAQKLVGVDKMEAPKADWPEEKWGALYDRLGRPKSPDDYPVPDFGENAAIDTEALSQFKELAFKEGLTAKQAESVLKMYGEYVNQTTAKMTEGQTSEIREKMLMFRNELGQSYETVIKEAEVGLKTFADEPLQKLILSNPALANEPAIIRHFHKLAKLAREDAAKSGDQTNPLNINSPEQAVNVLKKFEDDNASILFKRPETLSLHDQSAREKILKRREELYKMAYPSE